MKVVPSYEEAAVLSLKSGVDFELNSDTYVTLQEPILKNSEVEKYLNTAVKRILTLKYQLNLFQEDHNKNEINVMDVIRSEDQMAATEKASDESIILLKNEEKLLPLKKI